MKREDTAVQRAAADYRAAGFNPLLSMEQPAQAGTLSSFTGNAGGSAPQMGEIKNPIESWLEAKQMQANVQLTESQKNLIDAQAETEGTKQELNKAVKLFNQVKTVQTKAEAVLIAKRFDALAYDLKVAQETGTKTAEAAKSNNLYSLIEKCVFMLAKKFGIDLYDFKLITDGKKGPRDVEDGRGDSNLNDIEKEFNRLMLEYDLGY